MQLPSLGEISEKAKNAFRRFPVTLIWAILGSSYCIYVIDDNANHLFDHELGNTLDPYFGRKLAYRYAILHRAAQKSQKNGYG